MSLEPFAIHVADAVLQDLRDRLAKTRWADEIENDDWRYGTNLAYLRDLCRYWHAEFDWLEQEKRLNSFRHFRVLIGDAKIHFIHERGKGPRPLPILLTHGWPSTFFEMSRLIPLLTDPAAHGADAEDAFDVVVPSLPGYGFSDAPARSGTTTFVIAGLWQRLMTEVLGYGRFAAHGGDIGSGVTAWLGFRHPENLLGIHVTAVRKPYLGEGTKPLSEAERDYVRYCEQWEAEENGYGHIQSTRPQTLGYGLNDSPAGLAAWIIEKYRAWSDCGGDLDAHFGRDALLTNVTLYWVTETINSSTRLYFEHRRSGRHFGKGESIQVPCGICLTVEPVDRAPREWAERAYKVERYTLLPRGGHFAALEVPELLAHDIREFFRPLRGAVGREPPENVKSLS